MHIRTLVLLFFLVFATCLAGCQNTPPATTPAPAAIPAATTIASTQTATEDFCFKCHETPTGISTTFKGDIHFRNTLTCTNCHSGNSKVNDRLLAKAPATGFKGRISRKDVPQLCSGCHSNAKFMADHQSTRPTNQLELYASSVHGKQLAAGNSKAAECVDCHGIHNIRAVNDPQSPVISRNVSATCAKCHAEIAALLRQNRAHSGRTNCVTCHSAHDVQRSTVALLTGSARGCGRCHQGNSGPARTASQIAQLLTPLEAAGPASKEALDRARVAVHSFNTAAVQRAINTPATRPAVGGA